MTETEKKLECEIITLKAALISSQAYLLEYHDAEMNHARRLALKNAMAHNTKALNAGEKR